VAVFRPEQEELLKYVGQHGAWSWDGRRIFPNADTREGLLQKLDQAGIPFSRVVFGYVDDPVVRVSPSRLIIVSRAQSVNQW
jgi:hypothetical protein